MEDQRKECWIFFYSISKQGTKMFCFFIQGTKVFCVFFCFVFCCCVFFFGGGGVGEGGHKDRVLKGIKTNWYKQKT